MRLEVRLLLHLVFCPACLPEFRFSGSGHPYMLPKGSAFGLVSPPSPTPAPASGAASLQNRVSVPHPELVTPGQTFPWRSPRKFGKQEMWRKCLNVPGHVNSSFDVAIEFWKRVLRALVAPSSSERASAPLRIWSIWLSRLNYPHSKHVSPNDWRTEPEKKRSGSSVAWSDCQQGCWERPMCSLSLKSPLASLRNAHPCQRVHAGSPRISGTFTT